MIKVDKILFPVDFSVNCIVAAQYVAAMAGQMDASIVLLHVVKTDQNNHACDLLPMATSRLRDYLVHELDPTRGTCLYGG